MIIPRGLRFILANDTNRYCRAALALLVSRESLHLRFLGYAVVARLVKLRVLAVRVAYARDGVAALRLSVGAATDTAAAGIPVAVGAAVCVGGRALAGRAHDTWEEVLEEFAEGGHGAADDEEISLDEPMIS